MEGSAFAYFVISINIINTIFENNIAARGSDYTALMVQDYSLV